MIGSLSLDGARHLRKIGFWGLAISLFAVALSAEAGSVTTLAGTGDKTNNGDTGPALSLNIAEPFGLRLGPDGGLYIVERGLHRIRKLDRKTGEITTVAGTGVKGYTGDGGPATKATLGDPHELCFDSDGNLYIVERQNAIIRKIDGKTGIISTVVGTGKAGYGGDKGPGTKAQLRDPHSVVFDGKGHLYIADLGNQRVRKLDLATGIIDTVVGTGKKGFPADGGVALEEPLTSPRAIDVDGDTLWLVLREGSNLYRIDLDKGTIHFIGGINKPGFKVANGPAKGAAFSGPKGLGVGPDGKIYIVDSGNHMLRSYDPKTGTVAVVCGVVPPKKGFNGDSHPPQETQLNNPHGVGFDTNGALFIGDSDNHRVRYVEPTQP